ncbi:MAG: RsmB/NOP family class I SAM-dependent RNA methyltransferase [Sphingobacteriaceae bacterium]
MRAENQLKTFLSILKAFQADTPLTKFLPGFYRKNKKMGSTDRRMANRLIYNYFRLGKALINHCAEERLMVAEFLCNNRENCFLAHFQPDLAASVHLKWPEKLQLIITKYPEFRLEDVFPWINRLSAGINKAAFLASFFSQPDLFIRVRSGFEKQVKAVLVEANIVFREESKSCLALPNGTRLDAIFDGKHFFEVQDLSSQQTAGFFRPQQWESWWDACAASGGKSLLLHEQQPDLNLVVSDIRESILNNLDERFINAGIKKYQRKIIDLTQNPDPFLHDYAFDGVILDAPCTGSGTWRRTPEMIAQFSDFKINDFQRLQKSIALNVIKYIKPGKPLIYITCSAFKAENEDIVDFLVKEAGLQLEESKILTGYHHKADTMFVARLLRH